ncbi:hypothetical protein SEA_APEX_82 [Mycobacterium phage Apex]|uniref:Uncharacterized protein n=1 Tax=Mycobacterium phage BobbyK TaxID=3158892 RepID=A0AAU8GSM0_9CAUD|nr:hypothetical protein SEA_APEX_82 [Mycobacterium phage Apex]
MTGEGTYWCPVCTKTVDVVLDDEGKRCFAEHTNTAGEPCLISGMRNGWDDRP